MPPERVLTPLSLFSNLPDVETPRMLLRKLSLEDAADDFAVASDPEVSRYLAWEPPTSVADSREYLRRRLDEGTRGVSGYWAITFKGEGHLIGTIACEEWAPSFRRARFGYVLGKPYWNQGIMTEVLGRMIRFGFEAMDLNRIEAMCDNENVGSYRVMEKNGMRQEGLLHQHMLFRGHIRDSRLYAILRQDWRQG